MGRGSSREFYVNCSGRECWEILDSLIKNIKAGSISYKISGNGIRIKISGLSPEIKQAWIQVKRIAASTKSLARTGRGAEIPLDTLFSRTRSTFPPQVLVEVLGMRGFPTTVSQGTLRTAADPATLLEAAASVAEAFHSVPASLRGSAARKMITAVSVILGVTPMEAMEEAEKLGLLVRDPDTGRYILVKEWRSALRMLVRSLRDRQTGENRLT